MSDRIDSYEAAIEFLYSRINYERIDAQAYSTSDFKLDRMRLLLSLIGDPHERIPAIHVAGTKGKGSTCSMIASVLAAAGYKAGLYISPHISAFEERMTLNGSRPSPDELVSLVNRLLPVVAKMDGMPGQMQPTYFELATAIAWLYFEDRQADFAVLETGLGGRLDSTNVCRPVVCVITNVSRDHTHILGSTVRQIAWEKAGIIKAGVPVVSGVAHPEALAMVEQVSRERNAPLTLLGRELMATNRRRLQSPDQNAGESQQALTPAGDPSASNTTGQHGTCAKDRDLNEAPACLIDLVTPRRSWTNLPVSLRGAHQVGNAALAVAALDELKASGVEISEDAVRRGLARVEWPARVEVIARQPIVVMDAAHNWESARALIATLREEFSPRRRILIFAATRDKDVTGLLRLLLPEFETVIFTRYLDNPRSVPVEELQSYVRSVSNRNVHLADDPCSAWHLARRWASREDLIAITGSFFLVAELRDLVLEEQRRSLMPSTSETCSALETT